MDRGRRQEGRRIFAVAFCGMKPKKFGEATRRGNPLAIRVLREVRFR